MTSLIRCNSAKASARRKDRRESPRRERLPVLIEATPAIERSLPSGSEDSIECRIRKVLDRRDLRVWRMTVERREEAKPVFRKFVRGTEPRNSAAQDGNCFWHLLCSLDQERVVEWWTKLEPIVKNQYREIIRYLWHSISAVAPL